MMNLTGVLSIHFLKSHNDEFLNLYFSKSIPFLNKCEFVAMTTLKLMAHASDIARDLLLVTKLSSLIAGASYIFQWVSNK